MEESTSDFRNFVLTRRGRPLIRGVLVARSVGMMEQPVKPDIPRPPDPIDKPPPDIKPVPPPDIPPAGPSDMPTPTRPERGDGPVY
jgi:hypothetical protein